METSVFSENTVTSYNEVLVRDVSVDKYYREVVNYNREVLVDNYYREVLVDNYYREVLGDNYYREVLVDKIIEEVLLDW